MPLSGRSSYRIQPCSSFADKSIHFLTEIAFNIISHTRAVSSVLSFATLPEDAKNIYAIPRKSCGHKLSTLFEGQVANLDVNFVCIVTIVLTLDAG